MNIKRPKGTLDILPKDIFKWINFEKIVRDTLDKYNYYEMRTPIFEDTNLFLRGVGDTTDIVDKEMYTFDDKGERSLTLRPEGTASIVRSFIENRLFSNTLPQKFYYMGPMFRYSAPQKGRYRQFNQFGVEVFGSKDPYIDGEIIESAIMIFENLGLGNSINLEINSVGCPKCRPTHKVDLKKYLEPNIDKLCDTCKKRYEKNPLRIFDCKSPVCQELIKDAPTTLSSLCNECKLHFSGVKEYLDTKKLRYIVNPKMVRGLDYYTMTAFEIVSSDIGAQSSLGGGGRYDGLVEKLGGPETPGIGYALGIERVLLALEENKISFSEKLIDIFLIPFSEAERKFTIEIVGVLRKNGLRCDIDFMGRSFKSSMKYANKINAKHIIVIGTNEIATNKFNLKNMDTGVEKTMTLSDIVKEFKEGQN